MISLSAPKKWEPFVWPIVAAGLLVVFWHYLVIWSATKVFPSPNDVARAVAELAGESLLWRYTGDSLRRVAFGFISAVVLGIPFGLALGWYPAVNRVVNPVLQVLRPISPIAWIPIAILFFGIGDRAAIFLIFLGAFFPIVVTCVNGVGKVPLMFRRAGVNFGLSAPALLAKVIFPAALPEILIGLRLALGIAWLVVVAAEMIAVDSGLGYLVIDARNSGKRYDLVVAAILLIGVIGFVLDWAFRRVERLESVRWGFRHY